MDIFEQKPHLAKGVVGGFGTVEHLPLHPAAVWKPQEYGSPLLQVVLIYLHKGFVEIQVGALQGTYGDDKIKPSKP